MGAVNKDSVLGASLVLSVVSLVLLFGVTWYFQSSLSLLQQQVDNDRELLLELKSQVKSYKNGGIPHNVARRQLSNGCQCKDGEPGPRGPEGRKGDQGLPGLVGEKGSIGDMGPRGIPGDTGFPGMKGRIGEKGDQGDQGFPGPRGDGGAKGAAGVNGEKGDQGEGGLQGPKGDRGEKGDTGEQGPKGDVGEKGDKGDQGVQGIMGEKGDVGAQGVRGFNGTKGEPGKHGRRGPSGEDGEPGPKGETGSPGPQGVASPITISGEQAVENGGAVYVRWGHNLCPPSAELVYSGLAAGAGHLNQGGGSNPQCLPYDPTYLPSVSGKNKGFVATIEGAEYQLHLTLGRSSHQSDVPCAVCYVSKRSAVFMLPAKHECPDGWKREYYGYLMAERYTHYRTQYTCVDSSFTPIPNSSPNKEGMLFYPVEGRCGSLPCSPYDETRELTCSVCTK